MFIYISNRNKINSSQVYKDICDRLFDFEIEDGASISAVIKEVTTNEKGQKNAIIKINLSTFA